MSAYTPFDLSDHWDADQYRDLVNETSPSSLTALQLDYWRGETERAQRYTRHLEAVLYEARGVIQYLDSEMGPECRCGAWSGEDHYPGCRIGDLVDWIDRLLGDAVPNTPCPCEED